MLPRVLHRISVGPHQLPEVLAAYADTWRRHHPGWDLPHPAGRARSTGNGARRRDRVALPAAA
jgi:hypothetical protein